MTHHADVNSLVEHAGMMAGGEQDPSFEILHASLKTQLAT